MITDIILCMLIDLDQRSSSATFLWTLTLTFPAQGLLIFYGKLHVGEPLHLSLFLVDLLKFCCCFCDLDFVHSNFKVIQYLRLTIAFKLVLSQSSLTLLPLCNPAILSLAVSCHDVQKSKVKQNLPNILRLSPSIAHKTSSVLNGRKINEIHNYFSVTSAASIVLPPTVQ